MLTFFACRKKVRPAVATEENTAKAEVVLTRKRTKSITDTVIQYFIAGRLPRLILISLISVINEDFET